MKKLLWLGLALGALAGRARAQTAPPDLVVVRVSTTQANVTRGEGQSEVLTIDNGASRKALMQDTEQYHALFKRLHQEGYVLQSTFSLGQPVYSILLFAKKQ